MTTKNVVEYLPALTMCGNARRVSRYRRRHWAKRNHAGRHCTSGRRPYVTLPQTDSPENRRRDRWKLDNLIATKRDIHTAYDSYITIEPSVPANGKTYSTWNLSNWSGKIYKNPEQGSPNGICSYQWSKILEISQFFIFLLVVVTLLLAKFNFLTKLQQYLKHLKTSQ